MNQRHTITLDAEHVMMWFFVILFGSIVLIGLAMLHADPAKAERADVSFIGAMLCFLLIGVYLLGYLR